MLTVIPITAVGSGLSILIPLYILALHGSVLNVGFAVTLYNMVSIPSSLLWGKLADSFGKNRHKLFIISSILGIFPILLILGLASGPHAVEAMYGVYALVATAASPSINILVMGTRRNPNLPRFFSRYSIYGIVGSLMAMIPGLLIGNQIMLYLHLLLVLNVVGLFAAWFTIKDIKPEQMPMASVHKANRLFPVLNMLSSLPNLLTGQRLIEHIHKIFDGSHRNFSLLLLAVAMFNVASNLFGTSYIPYLKTFGMSYSSIFSISIGNTLGQLAMYIVIIYLVSKSIDLHKYYYISVLSRGAMYVFVLIPLFIALSGFFYINLVGYSIAGFSYALWNIAASVLLYDKMRGRNAGYKIGIWIAVLGLSAVAGSLLSGLISGSIGYFYTFVAASLVTLLSATVFGTYCLNFRRPGPIAAALESR